MPPRARPKRTAPRRTPSAAAGGHATYLYAVLARASAPPSGGAPAGPPRIGSLRWLVLGKGLWLAAADAPRTRYDAPAVEKGLKDLEWVSACAVAHERVIEHVSTLGTTVPMKLFTLFSSDARAMAELGRSRARLRAVLKRIEGRREWGVRVSVDEASARVRARDRAQQAAEGLSAGARFLTRKSQEHREVRGILDAGRAAADEVFEAATPHADQHRRRPPAEAPPGLRLLLDAAFLVREGRTPAFQDAVRRESERLAPSGYRVVLTGPWPPYNFVGTAGE
jgi:hypothetical protein